MPPDGKWKLNRKKMEKIFWRRRNEMCGKFISNGDKYVANNAMISKLLKCYSSLMGNLCVQLFDIIWKWGTLYWAICFLWENARTFCIITLLNINTSFMRHKKCLCENKRWNASSIEAHLVGRVGSWVISHSAPPGPSSGLMRSSNAQCLVCTPAPQHQSAGRQNVWSGYKSWYKSPLRFPVW